MKNIRNRIEKLELKQADDTKVHLLFMNGICKTIGEFKDMSIDEVEKLHTTHHLFNYEILPKGK